MALDCFRLRSVNVTSLSHHLESLIQQCARPGEQQAHITFMQEHALTAKLHQPLSRKARAGQCELVISLAPEVGGKASDGVAILAHRQVHLQSCTIQDKELQQYHQAGRVQIALADCNCPFPVRFINVYAFTGAEKEFRAADATASLMRAIEREVISTPDLPTVIVGDLNVEADRCPYVASLLESGSHVDACLLPVALEGASEGTCKAHNSKVSKMMDFFHPPRGPCWNGQVRARGAR